MKTESMINELEGKLTAEEMADVNGGRSVFAPVPDNGHDLTYIDDGGVPLNHAPFFQGIHMVFNCHPGVPQLFSDLRIAVPGILHQQGQNFLIQLIQTTQKHTITSHLP